MTSEKYDVPDEPENVKMSVTKQCVRRVNCLTDSSMNASNMRFINSYKRLELGKDALVYSYIVVLKGFCKNCSFSKTYNLIIDSDKIDNDVLRCFHKEIIKHYQREMSKKYPQLLGKISYDECLGTFTRTAKRALESIKGEIERNLERKNENKPKKIGGNKIETKKVDENDPETALRKYMKIIKEQRKICLNPLDYEFKDEDEYEYFMRLPIDLQFEYARKHLKRRSKDSKNKPSETDKMAMPEELHVTDVYSSTLDTSFVC